MAQELLIEEKAGENNQAIMEFGALQCKPKSPNCKLCPLEEGCFAFNNKMIAALPKKAKKIKIRKRYFEFFIINNKDKIFIQKKRKWNLERTLSISTYRKYSEKI